MELLVNLLYVTIILFGIEQFRDSEKKCWKNNRLKWLKIESWKTKNSPFLQHKASAHYPSFFTIYLLLSLSFVHLTFFIRYFVLSLLRSLGYTQECPIEKINHTDLHEMTNLRRVVSLKNDIQLLLGTRSLPLMRQN